MRLISLLACFAFTISLYLIDLKKTTHFSKSLWVPLFWMLLISSRSVSDWLNPAFSVTAESADAWSQTNTLERNISILFMVIGFSILMMRRIKWSDIIKNNGWLIWLYYYCIISLVWSDLPFTSFKRLIRDFTTIIMVLVILTDSKPFEALKTIIRRCMYILIPLSIVLIKWFPEYGRYWGPYGGNGLNIGACDGKNALGLVCAIGGLFFVSELIVLLRNRKLSSEQLSLVINIIFLAMISFLFILADSQSSFLSLIIAIGILITIDMVRNNIKYTGVIFFHITLIVIVILSTNFINMLIESLGRDVTMTGRTDLWEYLMQIKINPLVGTGYKTFWTGHRLDQIWRDFWWHPKQAHNGYLEIYLNLGIMGLLSLIALIITTYKYNKDKLSFNFEMGKFSMAIFFMLIIYNWTEATFISSSPIWFIFLFTMIKVPTSMSVSEPLQHLPSV